MLVLSRCLSSLTLASLAASAPVVAAVAPAGMILDLQGSGSIVENGVSSKLQLLATLRPQMQLTLDAGGKASLSLYATRTIYQLTGPAVATIASDKVVVTQGAPAVVKAITEKLVVAAEAANVTPGAYRMRGFSPVTLSAPEADTLLLDQQPTFSWDSLEEAKYKIDVRELDGRVLATGEALKRSWQLPANKRLELGKAYQWTVSYASSTDGKQYSAKSLFKMASKDQIKEFQALKPQDTAPVEEWVMYAATLQNRDAKDAARHTWQLILKRRPDLLQKVQELSQ